mgnify:CR=1 FL=1
MEQNKALVKIKDSGYGIEKEIIKKEVFQHLKKHSIYNG